MVDHPNFANEAYGWHFQYLTIIGITLATMTFTAGLAADLLSSRRLFLVKNILSVCGTPLEVLIAVLYWGLKMVDEKLVVPEWAETALIPDLGFHAVPALALVIDLLLFSPPWTITAMPSFGLATSIAFAYWFWVEQCYRYNGWYPYPLFEKLTTPWRVALFLVSAALMTLNTALLKWLYSKVNGEHKPAMSEAQFDKEQKATNGSLKGS
ncbi:hypothetical protein D8B26_007056 [Coccidioides posadasii str. Silveira]|uniref:uncharacterized protein n=1 Tax=Coccidioides posadasii (strain RMSCC 757 / Silveira) TaxID=443226 RepID=UPI001BF1835A|nr:hypothetical protein D8B26_007056 [Coccidioides posadasii str. Silveira]